MPKLEILVGMIASGKSTYARKRADEGAIVVSHDDLTEMLHARYRYDQSKREMYRRMEELLAREALFNDLDVVIDRTHLTLESRDRWRAFLITNQLHVGHLPRSGGIGHVPFVAVRFPIMTPETHALRRVCSDGRGRSYDEWLKVAEHHFNQAFEEPLSDDEGFDQIIDTPSAPHA